MSTTLVIPARDAAATLEGCLAAVGRLDDPPERVVVLDDGSTDATPAIARTHGAEVLPVPGDGGLGNARNHALAICATSYLAFLNADCYPDRSWLTTLRAALTATGAAVAGGRQRELRRGTWAERWKAIHLRQDLGEAYVDEPDFLSGGNLVVDLAQVRGLSFGTEFRTAYEDVAFCRALRGHGRRLVYDPTAIVDHDHPETMRTLPRKVWSYGVHSRAVGNVTSVWAAPRAFVRMHRRPNDQVRRALVDDIRGVRPAYVAIDLYLLCASFVLFVDYGLRQPATSVG